MDSPYKGSVMWKAFPCHDVHMKLNIYFLPLTLFQVMIDNDDLFMGSLWRWLGARLQYLYWGYFCFALSHQCGKTSVARTCGVVAKHEASSGMELDNINKFPQIAVCSIMITMIRLNCSIYGLQVPLDKMVYTVLESVSCRKLCDPPPRGTA